MSSSKLTTYFPVKKNLETSKKICKKETNLPKIKTEVKKDTDTSKDNKRADLLRQKQLDVLRTFDLKWEYGPCIGVSRLERWQHAEEHNLKPPVAIKKLIEDHKDDEAFTQCVWNDYEL